jgi:protease YdgD
MMRRRDILGQVVATILAACLALPVAAQTTKLRSLGSENDALAWRAVGRIDAKGVGFCTGTLIAPDLVLTAAHCVYDPRSGVPVTAEGLTFNAGMTGGVAVAQRDVAQVVAHPGYKPGTPISEENVRHDVALLRLATAIPTHEIAPFAIHEGDLGAGQVSVVSYGRGRSESLSRQNSCDIVNTRDRVVTMNCDVTFGSSGAPVFSHLNGRGRIASVISGTGHYGGRKAAFGMQLTPVLDELKAQMRASKVRPVATVRRLTVGAGKSTLGAKFVRP